MASRRTPPAAIAFPVSGHDAEIRSRALTNHDPGGASVPITGSEVILCRQDREISILVAREEITVTYARYTVGERVAGPHVHSAHTDAFYVLEGELTFELGREAETTTVSAGGFVAVPPGVAHSFRNTGDRAARWLTIHAPDGGFAAFMRALRDGVEIEWDISAVPLDRGLSASEAIVNVVENGNRNSSPLRRRHARPPSRSGLAPVPDLTVSRHTGGSIVIEPGSLCVRG